MTIQTVRNIILAYTMEHRFKLAEKRVEVDTFLVRDNLVLRVQDFPEDGCRVLIQKVLSIAEMHIELKNKDVTLEAHVHAQVDEAVEALLRSRDTQNKGSTDATHAEGEQLSTAGTEPNPEGDGGVDGKPATRPARKRRGKGAATGGQGPDGSSEAAGDGVEAEPEGPPGLDGWEDGTGEPGPVD